MSDARDEATIATVGAPTTLPAVVWPRAPLLLCASSSRTGPVEGLISLGSFLRAKGIDARIAFDRVREGEDLPGHLERAGLPSVPGLALSRKVRLADLLRDARTLANWVREGSPDLLHAAFAHDYSLALWATRRAGAARDNLRLVREAHRRADLAPGRLGIRHALLRRADGIVVRAKSYASALIAAGLRPARVRAIPGSVDANLFTPGRTEAAKALRESWGIPDEAPLFGMVARMKPERLQQRVLEAFVSIQHQAPGAHLVFIGRGEDEPRLQAQARSLASQAIHFGGYQRGPALVEAYRALDVAIWLREGNDGACRGVLEAMACGLPMIVGDDGAPPELVLPERAAPCGLVVDPLDQGSIAAALVELARDKGLRASLGQAGRARATTFTQEQNGEETLRFWRELRALPPVERSR
jgi:glycosyltransferase involved in cell wall biosynthesis